MNDSGAKSNIPSGVSKDDQLFELRKQRGHLKGRLTQFKKSIDSFQEASLSKFQISELKLRMQAASETYQKFNNVQNDIEMRSVESEMQMHYDYVAEIEALYFSTMATANCLIESAETEAGPRRTSCPHSSSDKIRSNIKLPDIKLPVFDGSYDRWLEFKNSYVTMIHNDLDLDAIQKFHYLRSSLSGSALQVISALEFTSANYLHAWDLLENRFHNPRLLVHNHIKSLFNISPLKQESPWQIRKLIDTVLRNLRALKTLDEPTDAWDTLIIYLIVSKLDASTEREWEHHKGSNTLTTDSSKRLKLDDLITFLKNRADMLEMINANHTKAPTAGPSSKPYLPSNKNSMQTISCVSTKDSGAKPKPVHNHNKRIRTCALCNENHALYTCVMFLNMSIHERLNFVQNKNLCRNCLREGHSLTECLFGPCKQCQQKHNSLLHTDNSRGESVCVWTSNAPAHNNSMSMPSTSTYCASADHSQTAERCNNDESEAPRFISRKVLLSTALIEVADADNQFHTARALLDNGSEHCFITEDLLKRLNATKIQSTIRISGVGQSVTQSNHLCDIFIRSKINDYNTSIKCFVLPRITSNMPSTNINCDFMQIPNTIQLADPNFNVPSKIDLLIGADIFWELLDDNRIRLPNGPYLQKSKLGWLISGPVCDRSLRINNQVQCHFTQSVDVQLKKFWELEDIPQVGSVHS